jgi:eukaryotic-like serine/threonine-protein kinase
MIGQTIGAYRIVTKIGEGGMGVVYLGEHQRIARKAAIKVLLPEFSADPQVVARFFNEARATSMIEHPGIVEILDSDVLPDGSAFIVMEFLRGESLGNLQRRGDHIPLQRALYLTRHIADALGAAHERQIVHRDLKPDNVYLPEGGTQPIKILDFGIAKLTGGGKEGFYKTRTGVLLGTPAYMSPEQCRGAGDIDHRTDMYSLGCMMFEMASGRLPFTSQGFGEMIYAHMTATPPPLRSIVPAVPAAIDALAARMLAKAPGDRPASMRALVAELDEVMAAMPASPTVVGQAPPRVGRPVEMVQIPSRIQTTLGSASAEKMNVVADASDAADLRPVRTKRGGPFLAVASSAAVVLVVGLWMFKRQQVPSAAPVAQVVEATRAAPEPVRSPAPERPTEVPPPPAPESPTEVAHAAEPARRPEEKSPPEEARPAKAAASSRPVSDKVKLVISSTPPGADVCFASDHVVLGKTRLDVTTKRSTGTAKLLIRMTGYRGQDIPVVADRDIKKSVTLVPLGPDDISSTENCGF